VKKVTSAEQRGLSNLVKKKPHLYLVVIGLWLLITAVSIPSFWRTFNELNSVLATVLFVPFIGCLVFFWFYGLYHLVFLVFSYLPRSDLGVKVQDLAKGTLLSKVAIIYCTYNDFNRDAALTCLRQDYPNYHVFILDVSTDEAIRKQVDAFYQEFASATTLVRLPPGPGFKARSLNVTLKTSVGEEYAFFAVCDADNYWPSDFLSRTFNYFLLDKRIAFVQAKATSSGHSQGKFAKDFEVAIDASWTLHQLPRDRYGLLMCMGHSVVVRREAWEKVGGYPEIVQEDTAFTMRLREHGYYGLFVRDVLCGEEFPEDFRRWHRRQFRLVQADTEILFNQMPGFLRNKNVSLIEKLDLLARTIRIPSQSLALPFLSLLFLIPLANEGTLSAASLERAYRAMLSTSMISITLVMAVSPLYPFFIYLRKRLLKLAGLSLRSITLHYSFTALAVISLLVYVLRGRAMFMVTGTKDGAAVTSQSIGRFSGFLQRLNTDSLLMTLLEAGVGLVLVYAGTTCGSLIVAGVAFVLIMSPLMRRLDWHSWIISSLIWLPQALIIAGLLTSFFGGIGPRCQYLAIAALSVLLF
jgi:cellulose synthase/poly-beta-1,6-N-acetylglucosamine synthase-like glycosyltransferase